MSDACPIGNLDARGIEKRKGMGLVLLAVGAGVATFAAYQGVGASWRALTFLVFWVGSLALLQAREKT